MSRLDTRPATSAELSAPIETAYLRAPRVPTVQSYPRIVGAEVHTLGIVEHNGIRRVTELRWTARVIDGQLDELHPEPQFDGPGTVVRKSAAQQEAWDYADENSDELIANAREC